jgi:Na+-translocating ferredoxin:NAD+ oxidoreductase RnfD subunit
MVTTTKMLQAMFDRAECRALVMLAESATVLTGHKVATALSVSPTTANGALVRVGFAT